MRCAGLLSTSRWCSITSEAPLDFGGVDMTLSFSAKLAELFWGCHWVLDLEHGLVSCIVRDSLVFHLTRKTNETFRPLSPKLLRHLPTTEPQAIAEPGKQNVCGVSGLYGDYGYHVLRLKCRHR